jgi:aldose 1-epimerase
VILRRGNLALTVAPHGAAITSLTVDGIETLLQPQGMSEAAADAQYLNHLVGRVANRIDRGRFLLDGETIQVSTNEGPNTLHGGEIGWSMRDWRLEESPAGVRAHYTSPDGEMGFPGEVRAMADIAFVTEDAFEIRYAATTERPTPINLTHHLYFNLSGRAGTTVLDHDLTLAAAAITPCGPGLIPTGGLMPTAGTPFDFREPRRLGQAMAEPDPQLALAGGIDHNFVLDAGARPALRLHCPESGVTLEIETDQPGVQLYAGQKMQPPWMAHQALAIEPQDFPDAVNYPAFPSTIIRPGETYSRRVLYRLSRS